jgi:hypothetical protein
MVAFVGLVSAARGAEDPNGTWKWTAMFGGNSVEMTLKLKLEGDKLTGATVREGQETAIGDATFKDNVVSFTTTREVGGQKRVTKYKGTLSGDTIKGKMARERDGQTTETDWEAKRQK